MSISININHPTVEGPMEDNQGLGQGQGQGQGVHGILDSLIPLFGRI